MRVNADPMCGTCLGSGKVWATTPGVFGQIPCDCTKEPQPSVDHESTVRRQETALALQNAIDAGPTHWRDEISFEDLKTCLEALQEGGKRENE